MAPPWHHLKPTPPWHHLKPTPPWHHLKADPTVAPPWHHRGTTCDRDMRQIVVRTLRQCENLSLAAVKSPALRQARPHAPHTPAGSIPHLVDTSMAKDRRSSSINLSRNRLQRTWTRVTLCHQFWAWFCIRKICVTLAQRSLKTFLEKMVLGNTVGDTQAKTQDNIFQAQ